MSDKGVPYHNQKGQVVGRLVDGWLVKRVNPEVHQLRKPPAYAIDLAHYTALVSAHAYGVKLLIKGGKEEWTAALSAFKLNGKDIARAEAGRQIALPLAYWAVHKTEGTEYTQSTFLL